MFLAIASGYTTPIAFTLKNRPYEAQLKGEFRWCANCLRLTPDIDLDRCGGCKQVGYCKPPDEHILKHMHRPRREALLKRTQCHLAHWKEGHKQDCARFQAEVEEKRREAEAGAAGGGGGGGVGGGGGGGGSGGGGGKKKKKGKGKKGRRR